MPAEIRLSPAEGQASLLDEVCATHKRIAEPKTLPSTTISTIASRRYASPPCPSGSSLPNSRESISQDPLDRQLVLGSRQRLWAYT